MTIKFGWCLDNRHNDCRHIAPATDSAIGRLKELICTCTCHHTDNEGDTQ